MIKSIDSEIIQHSKPWLNQQDIDSVAHQLNSKQISNGAKVEEFEKNVKNYLDVKYFVSAASGSNALYVILKAMEIGYGDEVILPTYVCHSVYDAIAYTGATPVLSDIGENWCIDVDNVKKHITNKTKAIIVVHSLGIYTPIEPFSSLNIPIIEDCCQCFASHINGYQPGKKGYASFYSFNAIKCFTTGEGGGISTADDQLIQKLVEFRKNKSILAPLNNIQSALGISQLNRYEDFLAKRRQIANLYFEKLPSHLIEKFIMIKSFSMFYRFLLYSSKINFNDFQNFMRGNGIAVRKGVDTLLHSASEKEKFINAENTLKYTISIPLYPNLDDEAVSQICEFINEYF